MKFAFAALIAVATFASVLSSVTPSVAKAETTYSTRAKALEKAIDEAAK